MTQGKLPLPRAGAMVKVLPGLPLLFLPGAFTTSPVFLCVPTPWSSPGMLFPPAVVADMEAMDSPALSHNMTYVAAQAMFYLVAGARRIQLLGEMETAHAGCGSRVIKLERHVSELSDDLQHSEQKVSIPCFRESRCGGS